MISAYPRSGARVPLLFLFVSLGYSPVTIKFHSFFCFIYDFPPGFPRLDEKRGEGFLPLLSLTYLLRRIKGILAKSAGGADPIFWDVLPGCAGGYTVFGVAFGGVIDIAAGAFVLHREVSSYLKYRSSRPFRALP